MVLGRVLHINERVLEMLLWCESARDMVRHVPTWGLNVDRIILNDSGLRTARNPVPI